jgi:hypothetical protein
MRSLTGVVGVRGKRGRRRKRSIGVLRRGIEDVRIIAPWANAAGIWARSSRRQGEGEHHAVCQLFGPRVGAVLDEERTAVCWDGHAGGSGVGSGSGGRAGRAGRGRSTRLRCTRGPTAFISIPFLARRHSSVSRAGHLLGTHTVRLEVHGRDLPSDCEDAEPSRRLVPAGNATSTRRPPPGRAPAVTRAPWASATALTTPSPRPKPVAERDSARAYAVRAPGGTARRGARVRRRESERRCSRSRSAQSHASWRW